MPKDEKPNRSNVNLSLDPEVVRRAKKVCSVEGRTLSRWIEVLLRRAVGEYERSHGYPPHGWTEEQLADYKAKGGEVPPLLDEGF